MRFIDANGLASFMSLGFVQNGFEMVARTGDLDFGNASAEANRHLLGQDWDAHFNHDPRQWLMGDGKIDVVAGLPPCSSWSCWTGGAKANRGKDAKAIQHTWNLVTFAGYVKPDAVVYESVQQAFSQGRETMLEMRNHLEDTSGLKYDLHHVKMNNLMVGGKSYRPRYFWVAVKKGIPFRTQALWPDALPGIMDTIGDLADLPDQWEAQPYVADAHRFVKAQRSKSGQVDGHKTADNIHHERIKDIFSALQSKGDDWAWGEGLSIVLKRLYERDGELPASWKTQETKLAAKNFDMGFSLPYRWPGDQWANVLTGGCLAMVVHPTRNRNISHRESARIQGLPDDWLIDPVKNYTPLGDTWGKAVSVDAGRWIGLQVKNTLEGNPQGEDGVKIGQREWLHHTDVGFSRDKARARYFPEAKGGISKAYDPVKWQKKSVAV